MHYFAFVLKLIGMLHSFASFHCVFCVPLPFALLQWLMWKLSVCTSPADTPFVRRTWTAVVCYGCSITCATSCENLVEERILCSLSALYCGAQSSIQSCTAVVKWEQVPEHLQYTHSAWRGKAATVLRDNLEYTLFFVQWARSAFLQEQSTQAYFYILSHMSNLHISYTFKCCRFLLVVSSRNPCV